MFRILYILFWAPLMLCFGTKLKNKERVPRNRGFILCANHTSLVDVIVLYRPFWRKIRFMAKKELFRTKIGSWFFRGLGAYPVNRGGADVESIKNTMHLLESGEVVCMFPQGTRHPGVDPRTTDIRGGVGMIAYHTGADVLPVYIRTKNNKVKLFRRTEIIVGELITHDELGFSEGGTKEYKAASELIFDRICTLGEEADGKR